MYVYVMYLYVYIFVFNVFTLFINLFHQTLIHCDTLVKMWLAGFKP